MILYHITSQREWHDAHKSGQYLPQGYTQDGFIHASFREQVLKTAARFYSGKRGLALLKIDSEKIPAEVKVENLDGGAEEFPHIYGPLPVAAVLAAAEFTEDQPGLFTFPECLEDDL